MAFVISTIPEWGKKNKLNPKYSIILVSSTKNFLFLFHRSHDPNDGDWDDPGPSSGRGRGRRARARGRGPRAASRPRGGRPRARGGRGRARGHQFPVQGEDLQRVVEMHAARVERDRVCIDHIFLYIIADYLLFVLVSVIAALRPPEATL